MKINHPIYTKVQYTRPFYFYRPTKEDFRPSITTWQNERLPLLDRIKTLELKVSEMEYLLYKFGVKL